MVEEVWRDVVGFEDYFQISESGSVWSKRTNKVMAQFLDTRGYYVMGTRIGGRLGEAHCINIHRAVAWAFLPKPHSELVEKCSLQGYGKVIVRHKDGIKTNNHYDNLEWGTYQDNTDDYYASEAYSLYVSSGEHAKWVDSKSGSNSNLSLFTDSDIEYIKSNYTPRCKVFGSRALGRKYGVSHKTIHKIVHSKSYKNHVSDLAQ